MLGKRYTVRAEAMVVVVSGGWWLVVVVGGWGWAGCWLEGSAARAALVLQVSDRWCFFLLVNTVMIRLQVDC